MLRKSIVLLFLCSAVVLAGCGAASGGSAERTVSVTGTGSVSLPPDIVVVNIGVQTQGDNVAQAVAENNRLAQQVTDEILAAGLAPEDVRTTYFSVSPQQQYDPQGNPTGAVSYWVDNTVTAKLRQVDQLGSLLEAALGAGATSINGVTFGVNDTSEAEVQARSRGIAHPARASAERVQQPGKTRQGPTLQPLQAIPRDEIESSLLQAPNIAQGPPATRQAGSGSVWGIALQREGRSASASGHDGFA